jgi:hypothetical protein
MTKDKALDLALEALEESKTNNDTMEFHDRKNKAITAIKQARSAPVQEPVAWTVSGKITDWSKDFSAYQTKHYTRPVYTPPAAQRQWVELTDEEIEKACVPLGAAMLSFTEVARAIEAKLKEKNESHRQHVTDGSPCWCEPETSYTDPETGASVIVHKEPQ